MKKPEELSTPTLTDGRERLSEVLQCECTYHKVDPTKKVTVHPDGTKECHTYEAYRDGNPA